jgi:hypothetical protein
MRVAAVADGVQVTRGGGVVDVNRVRVVRDSLPRNAM